MKVGDSLFPEASAPSKKAARQLAAEEAVKEMLSDGRLQLNKVAPEKWRGRGEGGGREVVGGVAENMQISQKGKRGSLLCKVLFVYSQPLLLRCS